MTGEEKIRVFITMHSKPEMSIFDWERHIEELQAALPRHVREEDWSETFQYGPNSGGFSSPVLCIETKITKQELWKMSEALTQAMPWMSVPIRIFLDARNVAEWNVSTPE